MKMIMRKLISLLGLLVMGLATVVGAAVPAAHGSQTDTPKMNGKLRVTTLSPEEIRYTGKPYVKELGAYAFNYRNYDPQVARWTTPDPSGFPDGANNQVYTNQPLFIFDPNGCDLTPINMSYQWTVSGVAAPYTVSWTGNDVWSYDASYAHMTKHEIQATGGLLGNTEGDGFKIVFEKSDSSNTVHRNPPDQSGKNLIDHIVLHCQLVKQWEDGYREVVASSDFSQWGAWYE